MWNGGSIVTMCSYIGISARCSSKLRADVVALGVNGIGVNGPATATHDE